jgi:ABC-type lipoprotein export system ATPase subunit
MTIGFYNVTPAPLAGVINSDTTVWGKECLFTSSKKYRIVAPSGKGKSTFIHNIYGLRNDYTGEIKIDDQAVKLKSADQWAELRRDHISIVYQDLRLFLHLTAMENILVKSALYKNYSPEKIAHMADVLGVSKLLHQKCQTLSYGERQRIAIIRSLIQPFEWLLLDEPFSHLDRLNSEKAAALIEEEVQARQAGAIVTSLGHDDLFQYDQQFQL